MIHPVLATMLAVITTDYPLEPGEADAVPAARGRAVVQPDLGRRRLLDQRRGRPARERRERRRARRRDAFAAALDEVCADLARQIVADGEGATVVLEIVVTGARDDGRGGGDRPPRRDLAAREDRGLRARPELGPRARRRRLGAVRRRLRAARPGAARASRSTGRPCSPTARRPACVPELGGPACRIELDLGPRRRRGGVPRLRPLVRLRAASTRSTRRERRRAQARRPRRGRGRAPRARAARRGSRRRRRARRRPADHGRDGASRDRGDVRRRAARDDAPRCSRSSASRSRRSTPRSAPRSARTRCRSGATRSACARAGSTGSGSSATPSRPRPPRCARRSAAGRIPVVAPLAEGPLNVNADEAAAALAVGLGAERILFVTDVPGVLVDGAVVDRLGRRRRGGAARARARSRAASSRS